MKIGVGWGWGMCHLLGLDVVNDAGALQLRDDLDVRFGGCGTRGGRRKADEATALEEAAEPRTPAAPP